MYDALMDRVPFATGWEILNVKVDTTIQNVHITKTKQGMAMKTTRTISYP